MHISSVRLRRVLDSAADSVLNLFFPRRCAFCGNVIPPYEFVCGRCAQTVKRIEPPVCERCGVDRKLCTCKRHSRHYDSITAPFYYEGLVRDSVHRYKFSGETSLVRFFSYEVSESVKDCFVGVSFDCVTCVPMTRNEKRRRGYDQSAMLAQRTADLLAADFDAEMLVKLYDTPSQRSLSAEERVGNVSGVFDISDGKNVREKTILLCDDVKTTGATLDECAKMLKLNGARAVYCAVFAIGRKEIKKEEAG